MGWPFSLLLSFIVVVTLGWEGRTGLAAAESNQRDRCSEACRWTNRIARPPNGTTKYQTESTFVGRAATGREEEIARPTGNTRKPTVSSHLFLWFSLSISKFTKTNYYQLFLGFWKIWTMWLNATRHWTLRGKSLKSAAKVNWINYRNATNRWIRLVVVIRQTAMVNNWKLSSGYRSNWFQSGNSWPVLKRRWVRRTWMFFASGANWTLFPVTPSWISTSVDSPNSACKWARSRPSWMDIIFCTTVWKTPKSIWIRNCRFWVQSTTSSASRCKATPVEPNSCSKWRRLSRQCTRIRPRYSHPFIHLIND